MAGDLAAWEQAVRQSIGRNMDVRVRPTRAGGRPALVIFLSTIVDKARLERHIMHPLRVVQQLETPQDLLETVEASDATLFTPTLEELESSVLAGEIVCLVEGVGALKADLREPPTRKPSEPAIESSTRGARDSFAESLHTNLGLVRMRIKDRRFRVENINVGRRTQTACAICYIEDVADPGVLQVLRDRLKAIDVDGTVDDSLLEQYITERPWSPFPVVRPTERPDWVAWEVMLGKVAVLVDGSATAILGPAGFLDFYRTPEDYKHGFWESVYLRNFLRVVGWFLGLYLPPMYIALTDVNPNLIPTALTLSIAGSREGVPFPAVVEVLFMEVALELLREAALRMPRVLASSVGIVGGLVLGEAAVQAKMISDIMVIVISLTALAQFVIPSQELGVVFRMFRYLFALSATLMGVYGLVLITFILFFHLASLNSLGVPYLSPATLFPRAIFSGPMIRPLTTKYLKRDPNNRPQDRQRATEWNLPWRQPDLESMRPKTGEDEK